MRLSKACGQFASRETEKQSPLQERGFRLIDKELWEKQLEDPRIPGYRAIHMTGKPPKRTRWMVDTGVSGDKKLKCPDCNLQWKCNKKHKDIQFTGRLDSCPAEEVECASTD